MLHLAFVDPNGDHFSTDLRREAQEAADQAETAVRGYLPGLAREVVVLVMAGVRVIPETGVNGASVAPGLVHWVVDPSRGVDELVRKWLRSTLFHELHHQARGWVMQGGERSTTFMRGVVSEGLATAFEREAGGDPPPWGDYPSDVRAWVDELLALPANADYAQWMFHHPDGRRWIGYRAGTFIADEATRLSGRTAADLVTTDTEDVLRWAGIG